LSFWSSAGNGRSGVRFAVGARGICGAAHAEAPGAPAHQIAVSTYSYWHFRTARYPVEQVIEDAARLGFDGVEILHRQMTDESPGYVNKLKQAAFRNGLALPMLSIHQDFISVSQNRAVCEP
jgi:L-ribulose-5-phosphate 3-epimerase